MNNSFHLSMRLLIFLILLSENFINHSLAQSNINIRAGLNNSRLIDMGDAGDYRYGEPEFDNKPAYYAGITYYRTNNKIIRLESSLNLCSKFVSLFAKEGGLGSSSTIDADYKLYYTDISIYPVISFGKRLKFVGSIRPNIGLLFASIRSGEASYYSISTEMFELPTSKTWPVSGNAKEEFSVLSIDLALNGRLEFPVTEKMGILLEYQYSRGLNNISRFGDIKYNFNNMLVGIGVIVSFF